MSLYLWIDPPGGEGFIHSLESDDQIAGVVAEYPIPDDNADREREYSSSHEGVTPEVYQAGRDYWGVSVLYDLPHPFPAGVTMVGPDGEDTPDE